MTYKQYIHLYNAVTEGTSRSVAETFDLSLIDLSSVSSYHDSTESLTSLPLSFATVRRTSHTHEIRRLQQHLSHRHSA